MKRNRLAFLLILILTVTVGGAYATWSYTVSQGVADIEKSVQVNLEADNVTTVSGGTLAATGSMSASIDDGGNYKAALVMSGDGFTVTYTPADTATENSVDSIQMKATISVTTPKYNGTDIISVTKTEIVSTATSSWTLTPEMIGECLTLADISLPTPDAYNAFEAAMADGITITVTISALE